MACGRSDAYGFVNREKNPGDSVRSEDAERRRFKKQPVEMTCRLDQFWGDEYQPYAAPYNKCQKFLA